MTLRIGFVTFAIICMWRDMDITKWLRLHAEGWLARHGWVPGPKVPPTPQHGQVARLWRFLWRVSSCPYCLAVYVAFAATWFTLAIHPWHREFWLAWWGAWGVHCVLYAAWLCLRELTKFAQLNVPDTPERYADDRQPGKPELEGAGE